MRFVPTKIAEALLELEAEHTLSTRDTRASLMAWLRRKRLLRALPQVVVALEQLTEKRDRTIWVTATVAHTPESNLKHRIESEVQQLFGKGDVKTQVAFTEDSTLIGGVRLSTNDTQYDFSLRRRLQALRSQL